MLNYWKLDYYKYFDINSNPLESDSFEKKRGGEVIFFFFLVKYNCLKSKNKILQKSHRQIGRFLKYYWRQGGLTYFPTVNGFSKRMLLFSSLNFSQKFCCRWKVFAGYQAKTICVAVFIF